MEKRSLFETLLKRKQEKQTERASPVKVSTVEKSSPIKSCAAEKASPVKCSTIETQTPFSDGPSLDEKDNAIEKFMITPDFVFKSPKVPKIEYDVVDSGSNSSLLDLVEAIPESQSLGSEFDKVTTSERFTILDKIIKRKQYDDSFSWFNFDSINNFDDVLNMIDIDELNDSKLQIDLKNLAYKIKVTLKKKNPQRKRSKGIRVKANEDNNNNRLLSPSPKRLNVVNSTPECSKTRRRMIIDAEMTPIQKVPANQPSTPKLIDFDNDKTITEDKQNNPDMFLQFKQLLTEVLESHTESDTTMETVSEHPCTDELSDGAQRSGIVINVPFMVDVASPSKDEAVSKSGTSMDTDEPCMRQWIETEDMTYNESLSKPETKCQGEGVTNVNAENISRSEPWLNHWIETGDVRNNDSLKENVNRQPERKRAVSKAITSKSPLQLQSTFNENNCSNSSEPWVGHWVETGDVRNNESVVGNLPKKMKFSKVDQIKLSEIKTICDSPKSNTSFDSLLMEWVETGVVRK